MSEERELTGKHLINGSWLSVGNEVFEVVSPVDGSLIAPSFYEATDSEVDHAVEAAHTAFLESHELTPEVRSNFLETLADSLLENQDALIGRCLAETGYPLMRAKGELLRTVGQTRQFAQVLREGSWVNARIDRSDYSRRPVPKPEVRSMLEPLGVVGVIGASNFPFAISVAGTDTVTALAVGCSVVVKGHPAHAGTCELLAEIIRASLATCSMPTGLFSFVQGGSHRVGERLVNHPLLRALAFTGSESGGRSLYKLAANRVDPIPVFAEMGSVNPVVILPNAAADRSSVIAQEFLDSLLLGGGQFCTNPGLLLLPDTIAGERLIGLIKRGIEEAPAPTLLHRGISDAYAEGVDERRKHAGVECVNSRQGTDTNCGALPSVLIVNSESVNSLMLKELFGPVAVLVRWKTSEDLLAMIKQLQGQLTCTLHAHQSEWNDWGELIRELRLRAGRFLMNGFPTGVEPCYAMHHGGPFPAASHPHFTSIGMSAITRFTRPMCYQDVPDSMLPEPLVDGNPRGILRQVDGIYSREPLV